MEDSAGVYTIPATIMENKKRAFYIGMTSRKFKNRLVEHVTYIKINRYKSATSKLYQEQEVIIDLKKAKY